MILDILALKEKVKELISKSGDYSAEGFAEALGLKGRGGYYDFLNKRKKVSTEEIRKIAGYFGRETEYFITQKAYKGGPVLDADITASDIEQYENDPEKVIGYVDLGGFRKCKFFVRVKGPSMEPDFKTGDYIGLEPILDLRIIEYGQPYAITTKTNQKLVKVIRRGKDNEHLILRSKHPDHDDIDLHKDDIDKLFKVHGPLRDQWQ
jgi:hypothetical protein